MESVSSASAGGSAILGEITPVSGEGWIGRAAIWISSMHRDPYDDVAALAAGVDVPVRSDDVVE